MPQISIIIPVYNTEQYLSRCLDSVLNQTFLDFELLLVDDGSTDNSGVICDDYARRDSRVRVFHQKNSGQSVARNIALDWIYQNSDSQYISFVDSDDWVHARYLEFLYTAITKYNSSLSQCLMKRTDSQIEEDDDTENDMVLVTPEEQYTKWFSAYPWGKLYKKDVFNSIRYPEGQVFEDVAIWYKILFSLDAVAIVKDKLYYYYQRKEGTTNANWTPAKMAWVKAWDETLAFAEQHNHEGVLREAVKRACWVYNHEVEEIDDSKNLSEVEKKTYRAKVIRRLRKVLGDHKKELMELDLYRKYYAVAYPRLDWFYWKGVGLKNKLKR